MVPTNDILSTTNAILVPTNNTRGPTISTIRSIDWILTENLKFFRMRLNFFLNDWKSFRIFFIWSKMENFATEILIDLHSKLNGFRFENEMDLDSNLKLISIQNLMNFDSKI